MVKPQRVLWQPIVARVSATIGWLSPWAYIYIVMFRILNFKIQFWTIQKYRGPLHWYYCICICLLILLAAMYRVVRCTCDEWCAAPSGALHMLPWSGLPRCRIILLVAQCCVNGYIRLDSTIRNSKNFEALDSMYIYMYIWNTSYVL